MIIIISNPVPVTDEATIINELFDTGMELFHLRKPDGSPEKLKQLLNKINPEHYSKIALHQHHEIAGDFGIARIHFTEKKRSELNEDELRKLKEANMLSTSVHSMNDYKILSADFEYAFYGPVFNSISKQDYEAVVEDGFSLTGMKNETKIIAIGGINEDNVSKAFNIGFDGVALLGAIWQRPADAIINYKKIRKRCIITAR
ncbi:MAG: thiamine phosphate synthase [Ferruginibacter sp.]